MLRSEFEMRLDWQPFFLRPETPPQGMPVPDYVKEKRKDPNNPLKARANKLGLVMVESDVMPSTRRAHEAAEFGRSHGKLEEIHAALLTRYWSRGEDLYQLETLRGAATDAGLDPGELQEAIESGQFTPAVETAVKEAGNLGIRAVPTFLVDYKYVVEGAQEAAIFRQALKRIGH
jgi:predicted DsbA family dithiol-disulfide isomerase